MITSIQRLVRKTDSLIARGYLSLFRERNALLCFLFHSMFRDEQEIAQNMVDPLQRTTVEQFRRFVGYYLENGYRFIAPGDLLSGLDPAGKYAIITFDDGYHNNTLVLPVLEEFQVPAMFFVSTDNVLQGKSFWWDVLYRERIAQGASNAQVYDEGLRMKSKTTEQIESELKARFGEDAFVPRGAIDRPFTPSELREFASHPLVHLGNHTANHAILTNYTPDQVQTQIRSAQESIEAMTGIRPSVIAYPNGAHSWRVVEACEQIGLKLGFTIKPKKNFLPLTADPTEALCLGRFAPHGEAAIEEQCRTFRSDVLLYGALRSGYLKWNRGSMGSSI